MTKEQGAEKKMPKMAICYDFDKTLSPDDMQAFTLIPSFGIDKEEFWEESNQLAKENLMDNNLAWMYELIRYSNFKGKSLKREYFNAIGKEVPLYSGVETWFDRLNKFARKNGVILEHYIISSGLKEIIEGSRIANKFKRIYASSYLYSSDGVAVWPTQAINYTNKTQYIFRIAKGFFEEYDERVNDTTRTDDLNIPYENIVYIGDSATDIPCMRLVKSKGGYAIGVFDPEKNSRKKVYQLFNDGRINFYAPADYSEGSTVEQCVIKIIREVAAREAIKAEQMQQNEIAGMYGVYTFLNQIADISEKTDNAQETEKIRDFTEKIRAHIEGNIE